MTSNPSHYDDDSEPKLIHMGFEALLEKINALRGLNISIEEYHRIYDSNNLTSEEEELLNILDAATIEIMVGKADELEADEQAEDILRDALK